MKNRPEATERFPDSKDARPTADHLTDRLLVIPSERKLFESRTPPRVYFARSTIEIVVAFVISVSRPVCSPRLLHRAYNNLLLGPGFFHPFPTSSSTSVSSNIEKPALFVAPRKQPPRYRLKLHRGYFAPIHIATIRESLLLFSPFPVIIRHDGMP